MSNKRVWKIVRGLLPGCEAETFSGWVEDDGDTYKDASMHEGFVKQFNNGHWQQAGFTKKKFQEKKKELVSNMFKEEYNASTKGGTDGKVTTEACFEVEIWPLSKAVAVLDLLHLAKKDGRNEREIIEIFSQFVDDMKKTNMEVEQNNPRKKYELGKPEENINKDKNAEELTKIPKVVKEGKDEEGLNVEKPLDAEIDKEESYELKRNAKGPSNAENEKSHLKGRSEEIEERYKEALREDIRNLNQEAKEIKRKRESYLRAALEAGNEEISMDIDIKKNENRIKANENTLKEMNERKIKKQFMDRIKKSGTKISELKEEVEEVKNKVEGRMADLKTVERRKQSSSFRIETLNIIHGSNEKFLVLNGNEADFNQQPQSFSKEMGKLVNVQVINVKPVTWEGMLVNMKDFGQEKTGRVLIIILPVDKEMFSSDIEMLNINLNKYVRMLLMTLKKAQEVADTTLLVVPPATEDSIKTLEAISNRLKEEKMHNKTQVLNLFETQKSLGERGEEDENWERDEGKFCKKMCLENSDKMSEFSVRYIITKMAEVSIQASGEPLEVCDVCALFHSKECPIDIEEKKEKDKEEKDKDKKEMEKRKLEEEDQSVKKSKKEDKKNKDEDNREKSSRKKNDYDKYERDRNSRDELRSDRNRWDRDRGDRDRERSSRREYKKTELTEKCTRCLQDHNTEDCNLPPSFVCNFCRGIGHHRICHTAKKDETISFFRKQDSKFEILPDLSNSK